jgi:CO/xanthine dehydrogenase FAD-binding subunit
MRTAITPLELVRPRSLKHALQLLRETGSEGGLVPLAGCTDLFVALNFGTLGNKRFLDLWPLDELRGIGVNRRMLAVGALATFTQIIRSPLVRRRLPMLVAASREIGGAQIQNRGTLGGNIANASPAGDALPVLAAADALVVLRNADGIRRVPFVEFYTGYRKTVMEPDELIVAVEFPPVRGEQWFRKVGTRAAQAISKVVMAAVRAPEPRIAIGSVAPTVIRARRAEQALAGGASIDDAARLLLDDITPIDDLRSTADYRRQVAANLLRRFWTDTQSRAITDHQHQPPS